MTAAVILAAGHSTRMGQPKALLRHPQRDTSFVAHLVARFRAAGIPQIFVVGRASDDALRMESKEAAFVVNPRPDDGQLSSLVCGIDAAAGAGASQVLVMPVDVPLVSDRAVAELLRQAAQTDALVVRATHEGRHGHPVIFKAAVFDEIRRADPEIGARAVVRADPTRVLDVDVGDAGVTIDVDTPDDYRRIAGREPF